jgi:3-deoxy-D-manno-oct-2-ulosonic acid (Kdo) hydroxylase
MNPTPASLEERLEGGEIVVFEPCPFALPAAEELAFLRRQRPGASIHKDISFNPARETVTGFAHESPVQASRLREILGAFAQAAAAWLAGLLPAYARSWHSDRVSFRPEEEATRKLRMTARNDLLHFDAFPSRPTGGRRILRLFVNINPTDPRVWATSETFRQVFDRYGVHAGLPGSTADGWPQRLGQGLLSLFQPGAARRTPYDNFMLRLHHFLKTNSEFQERSARRLWHFPPGAAWLVFADAVSHAELRGQFAMEHSFFIASGALALPDESPLAILDKACGTRKLFPLAG